MDGEWSKLDRSTDRSISTDRHRPTCREASGGRLQLIAEDSTEFTLRTKPGIFGNLAPLTGCAPLEILMDDSSSSEPWTRHRWDFGDGQSSDLPTPLHTYQQAGVYTVTHSVWSDTACIDSAFNRYVQRINVLPAPRAGLWVDTQRVSIYAPQFVFRDSSSSDAVQWGTIMGDGTEYICELYCAHAYSDTGTYTVSHWVLAANGCSDTALRTLRVDAEFRVFIPNAFRPNDDGRNEVFRPYGADWRKMELTITDRWGGVVFRTTDPLAGWNGRRMNQGQLLPEGIYAYRVLFWEEEATLPNAWERSCSCANPIVHAGLFRSGCGISNPEKGRTGLGPGQVRSRCRQRQRPYAVRSARTLAG